MDYIWRTFQKRRSFESLVPLVGGVIGLIGLLICPAAQLRPLWWIPLILDFGCLPLLFAVIADQIWKKLRR
jgi:hypothetical protein